MSDLVSDIEQQLAALAAENRGTTKVDLMNKLFRLLVIEKPDRALELAGGAQSGFYEPAHQCD